MSKCFFFFRESDIPPSGFLISYLALHSPRSPLFLVNSLVSLSAHSPPHFSFPQYSWKLNPVIFPPTVPFPSAHLGMNLHIIQINISEVSGEYSQATSKTPTHPPPNPSALLVPAEVLFCLPEPALMACFSQHLSHVQERHLAKFKWVCVRGTPRL